MRISRCAAIIALAVTLPIAAPAAAQPPLAEVARAEQARRATISGKSRVYTNADLSTGRRLTTSVAVPRAPESAPAVTDGATPQNPGTEPAATERDESYWRERITAARDTRRRAELVAAALQNRVVGLWAEFTARDDPQARAGLERDRQAALAELEQTRTELERLAEEISDIQEEARRAGAPSGWLR